MKKYILITLFSFLALPALAHANGDTECANWMMGSGGMMGGQFFGVFGFLFPLLTLAFWGLTIALLVALVRWVWKKGDEKK